MGPHTDDQNDIAKALIGTRMRTLATFQSTAFNTTQPKSYFINRDVTLTTCAAG
jgi:hypothetical protein